MDVFSTLTDIILTQSPPGPVFENTKVTFTCEATIQESQNLIWTVDGAPIDATAEEMINNKQGKRSVLKLTITKALKGKAVECYV